jgi:hypothetical protein
MTEVDYREVICLLVRDGLVTSEQIMERVGRLSNDQDEKYHTPTWETSRRIITVFNEKLKANSKKAVVVNITSLSSIEKLLRLDKHTEEEILEMIDWATSDEFWHRVILSTGKLRKHYETMNIQRSSGNRKVYINNIEPPRPQPKPIDADWVAELNRRNEESVPPPVNVMEEFKRRVQNGK